MLLVSELPVAKDLNNQQFKESVNTGKRIHKRPSNYALKLISYTDMTDHQEDRYNCLNCSNEMPLNDRFR